MPLTFGWPMDPAIIARLSIEPLAPEVAIRTAELSSPSCALATFPVSAFAASRIVSMFSSRVSCGVLPGLASYFLPSFPNFSNSESTLALASELILTISSLASGGRSSSSIPVVNPIAVQMAIVIFVILLMKSAPLSVPCVWTTASRRRPSSAPIPLLSIEPETSP